MADGLDIKDLQERLAEIKRRETADGGGTPPAAAEIRTEEPARELTASAPYQPEAVSETPSQPEVAAETPDQPAAIPEASYHVSTAMTETSQKPVVASERETGRVAESPAGPNGLDVGTTHIVVAQNDIDHIRTTQQLNAFFTVPKSTFAKKILVNNAILHYELDNLFYIIGYSADNFANMFNTSTRRSIKKGLISTDEKEGISVIQAAVVSLLNKPKRFGETICFAVPGEPIYGTGSVLYHESIIKRFLSHMGYTPISINEAMAVVLSELAEEDHTGIGISFGGGMCNVCLSYLSFPVITFSLPMGGDYIDMMVGQAVGEPATKIKLIKEHELDFSVEPKGRVMTAIHIFYDELIRNLIESLQRVLSSTDQIPTISASIPIVLSGGTAMPKKFTERFVKVLGNYRLPVDISTVRLAEDPLHATAKGALMMAMTESESDE